MADAPPLALFEFGSLSICRQAAHTMSVIQSDASGQVDPSDSLLRSVPKVLRTRAVLHPVSADPRRYRDLPWHIHLSDPDVRQMTRIGKLSVVYSFTLILIPGAILISLVRRRKLDAFAFAAILIGCISVFVGFTIGDAESETHMRIGRLVLALAPLPVIQFIGELFSRTIRGHWRRVSGWLMASIIVSTSLALLVLVFHGARPELGLEPNERYSMDGWYLIGLWGTYLTGLIMIVVAVGWPCCSRIRARLFGPRQTT
jgi:hypothetical protein